MKITLRIILRSYSHARESLRWRWSAHRRQPAPEIATTAEAYQAARKRHKASRALFAELRKIKIESMKRNLGAMQ